MNPQNQLDLLKNKLSGEGKKEEKDDEESVIDLHHVFMKEYGWIPLEEFKSLPIPTLLNLSNCIKKEKEMEKKAYNKSNKKGRMR